MILTEHLEAVRLNISMKIHRHTDSRKRRHVNKSYKQLRLDLRMAPARAPT